MVEKLQIFFFFFFFASHISNFKTTTICFGSTKIEIWTGKKHFSPAKKKKKKSGKNYFAPSENFPVTPMELTRVWSRGNALEGVQGQQPWKLLGRER